MTFLPNPYVALAIVVVWIGTLLGGFFYGDHMRGSADAAKMDKAIISAQQEAMARQSAQDKITLDAAVSEAQSQQTIETVYQTIEQKVPVYVTKADRSCHLSNGFVWLWNAGVTGQATSLSPSSGQSDGSPSSITAADALNNAVRNFAIANQNAEQLGRLQSWIKQQEQVK